MRTHHQEIAVQSGVKNHLTKEEIQNAKAIIIAADTNVDLTRFNGKKLIKTRVADGIHKSKELIERALAEDAPIYHGKEGEKHQEVNENEKEGIGRSQNKRKKRINVFNNKNRKISCYLVSD